MWLLKDHRTRWMDPKQAIPKVLGWFLVPDLPHVWRKALLWTMVIGMGCHQ